MARAAAILWAIVCFGLILPPPASAAQQAAHSYLASVAVFNFELVDTSLEGASHGIDPAETARLKLISNLLRDELEKSGRYNVVDIAPAASKIANAGLIYGCNGCETDIARSLGADRAITGTIRKISTLILIITIVERDVATGKTLQIANAQIRGDTNESWTRGVSWLVHNRLLARK